MKPTDVRVVHAQIHFLPTTLRVPLKFGPETVESVVCLRVRVTVERTGGGRAEGWGETPLSVSWVWPSGLSVAERAERMEAFSGRVAEALVENASSGHPIEIAYDFIEGPLAELTDAFNQETEGEDMPYLASLVAFSAFDIALHDAYGHAHQVDVYDTYGPEFLSRDLADFLQPAEGSSISFRGQFPDSYLNGSPPQRMPVWHLVGGVDPLDASERSGSEPDDGYPVTLEDWIDKDGLQCLKVKLRGTDSAWDYERLLKVGQIGMQRGLRWLSADFNCTVTDPAYVNEILDRLLLDSPDIYARILYVEQPFPYELEELQLDVRSVAARKPLFLDESAHDWRFVKLGRDLGWSGVALKTCKTQTGALLSLCWGKAHGMPLMVQDLTNPMLAMVPHVRLAAHAGTIQGVECNGMQFYPEASLPEQKVHPGLYQRRNGEVDLSTLGGHGMGYQLARIERNLPEAAGSWGS